MAIFFELTLRLKVRKRTRLGSRRLISGWSIQSSVCSQPFDAAAAESGLPSVAQLDAGSVGLLTNWKRVPAPFNAGTSALIHLLKGP